jgi:aryl-alcohol dehydrogenase-like predicted oxidoreductase
LKEYCRARNLTLIAYSVLMQGAYTREDKPVPAQYAGPDAEARFAMLKEVAAETGATLSQTVIAWMLHSDVPLLPIIAGSTPEQVRENTAAVDIKLTDEQMRRLNTAGNPDVLKAWLR